MRIPTSSVVHWSLTWSRSSSTTCRVLSAWDRFRHSSCSAPAIGYSSITLACRIVSATHTHTHNRASSANTHPQPEQHGVCGWDLSRGIHSVRQHEVGGMWLSPTLGGGGGGVGCESAHSAGNNMAACLPALEEQHHIKCLLDVRELSLQPAHRRRPQILTTWHAHWTDLAHGKGVASGCG